MLMGQRKKEFNMWSDYRLNAESLNEGRALAPSCGTGPCDFSHQMRLPCSGMSGSKERKVDISALDSEVPFHFHSSQWQGFLA